MTTQDYITTIDTNYTDDLGNNLIWSNDVLSVHYYNATTTGTEENWVKDWDYVNTVVNNNFSSTITGADWVFETDSSGSTNTFEVSRFGGWNNTDLLKDMDVTSSGYSVYSEDYLVDFKSWYGWRTSTSSGSGYFAATVDMTEGTDINNIWLLPGFGSDSTMYLKDYRIGISDTGGEDDFTIVASGTTTSGSLEPKIHFIGNNNTRYVKLYVDDNWGSSSYTTVGKISGFYDPDWSMFGYKNTDVDNGGSYAQWTQDIDLTGTNYLFVDARGYMTNAYQVGELKVLVDNDVLKTYNWSNTGLDWIDSNDDDFWTRNEEVYDVSTYTGVHPLKLRMWEDSYHRGAFMGFFDSVNTQPAWYRESFSTTRGSSAIFPDEVYIISDRKGVSIVDKERVRLWMRFQVGPGYALESAARDIYADEGKVYLATSRGLVVIDFENNRVWKYSEDGIEYRMSLSRRNEYAFWFTYDDSEALSSSDVYSVSSGSIGGTDFVVVGTGAGMSYIEEETLVKNSSFSYPVIKVSVFSDKLYYIGGFGTNSRFGVFEDLSDIQGADFGESSVLFSDYNIISDDSFYGEYSNQWYRVDSDLPLQFDGTELTVSGTKIDIGITSLVQKYSTPNRPFTAVAKVKIKDWVDRTQGGFHFGLDSGWPYETHLGADSNNAAMLSASNGTEGVYFENERFSSFPSTERWNLNYSDGSNQKIEYYPSQDALRVDGYFSASLGTNYSPMTGLGSTKVFPSCPDFIAKVKVKFTDLYEPATDRVAGIVFGVTDGQYLGEGEGTDGLSMAVHRGETSPNPAVYCVAEKTDINGWAFDTTVSGALFEGDGTSNADWHTWEISYDSVDQEVVGMVDGIYVGSKTNTNMGSDIGVVLGPVGNDPAGHIEAFFKDFEIDFGEIQDNQKEKYVLQKVESDSWTIPTVSGTHLDGLDFSTSDATELAEYREWKIVWDGSNMSGYIDDVSVGSSVAPSLGDQPTLFFAYNMPATLSGNNTADIRIKDFSIQYDDGDTVISGSPNNFYGVSGSYLGTEYNTIYIATASGVNQLMYDSAATISGTPTQNITYGISDSGSDREVIHGNVKNCSAVETDSAGPSGLMYVGTSRFTRKGWERFKDRPGATENDLRSCIGAKEDGSVLFLSYNPSGGGADLLKIYRKDINRDSKPWETIFFGDQTEDVENVGDSRVYPIDPAGDGNIYFIGPKWMSVYNIDGTEWVNADANIGCDHGYAGGGTLFDDWEIAPCYSKKEFFIANYSDIGKFSTSLNNWITGKYFYGDSDLPLTTANCAIVYSDVDDSLYLLQKSTSGSNFFRMPLSTLVWSSALSDSPYEYDFDKGISCFYRPSNESVYFIFKGSFDAYGRKLVRYDVKEQQWYTWGEDVPVALNDHMSAVYIAQTDELYVVVGESSLRVYKYSFSKDDAPRFVSWDIGEGLLPENSVLARYRKVSPSSGEYIQNDSFDDGESGVYWVDFTSGSVSITDGSSNLSIYAEDSADGVKALRSQSVPMPACNFTATLNVKIKDMPTPDTSDTVNSIYFGVSDHLGSPGFNAKSNESSEMGNRFLGVNGLWMIGYNTQALPNRYSLWKRESGSDTRYGSTVYELFSSSDATSLADYRTWKVSYDHPTQTLSAYIDDSFIGEASLLERGFEHGMMFNMGAWNSYTNTSGTVDTYITDFDITFNDTTDIDDGYLHIYDNDDYGYVYYEKLDQTLISGSGYAYESDWRVVTYSVSSNVYVTSLGSIEDGHKSAHLAALYTGSREVGLYFGGDPREQSSYSGTCEHDWSLRSTYKIVSDYSTIKVYIDGEESPSIECSYDSLPDSCYKRVRFGTLKPNGSIIRNHLDNSGGNVMTTGTWSLDELGLYGIDGFYGSTLSNASGSVSDSVTFNFDSTGDVSVYIFYNTRGMASTDTPYTVHHSGVVSLPSEDSYATNPLTSVNDNVDEFGSPDANATTVDVNQQKLSDGRDFDSLENEGDQTPSGYVYLGTYTNVDRVVVTADSTGTYTLADTVMLTHCVQQPRSRSDSRVYNVSYTVGEGSVYMDSDFESGFTVVDMFNEVKLDYYSDSTSPSIVDDNVQDLDVV